jgi:hypothetical protein
MTRHDLVVLGSGVVALGYAAFPLFWLRAGGPLDPLLLQFVIPAVVALAGGVGTAVGRVWGPILVALAAAFLALWLVYPLAPLFTAALLAITGVALLQAGSLVQARRRTASV